MTVGMISFNPAAHRALTLAHQEVVKLGHKKTEQGNLLLALLQDESMIELVFKGQHPYVEEARETVTLFAGLHLYYV